MFMNREYGVNEWEIMILLEDSFYEKSSLGSKRVLKRPRDPKEPVKAKSRIDSIARF